MPTSTIDTGVYLLKEVYKEPLRVQFNEESSPVYAAIDRKSETAPDKFKFALEYGRFGSIGAFDETGLLPEAAARMGVQAECSVVNLAATIELSDKVMKASKNNARSFVDHLTDQVKKVAIDGKDMIQRNWNSNHFGVFGVVASAAGSTVTLDLDARETLIEAFYPGQVVDIGTVTAGVFAVNDNGVRILDVDRVNGVLTFAAAVTSDADDVITLHGDYGKEMYGLGDILIPDNIIYDINRANNKWFNPQYYDRGGGSTQPFDSSWLSTALDDVQNRVGADPKFIVCNSGVFRAYEEEQREYKRNINYKEIDGGIRLATYRDTPISVEAYFMRNSIGIIDTETLALHQLSDWDWLDEDGAMLKLRDNRAVWWAAMVLFGNIACYKSAANALITGIAEVA